MSQIRHILMHVDSSEQSLDRLAYCRMLAARFEAQVTALYAVTPWLLLYPVAMDIDGGVAAQLSTWDEERLKTTHARFLKAIGADDQVRWAQLDSETPFDFASEALYADLMVLGHRSKDGPSRDDVPHDFNTHAILHSGKPALILPPGYVGSRFPEVVLVGWNASRESAAALSAAMPFLKEAKEVHVAYHTEQPQDNQVLDALCQFLRLHDVDATSHFHMERGHDTGNMLLDQAGDLRADLLVMGCYGHSRAREWALGGATKTVLDEALLPVLMAH